MTKLEAELRRLDRLPVPALDEEIRERSLRAEERVRTPVRSRRSRALAAATALALFALGGTLAWRALRDAGPTEVATPDPGPVADPWAGFAEGWTALPPMPEARVDQSVGWTGREVIWWGGRPAAGGDPSADGFAFDPVAERWRPVPPAPPGATISVPSRTVWTGTELLFYPAGVAYDPATDAWRELPPAPHDPRYRQTAVAWTGAEMVVFGGGPRGSSTARQGAAYDPAADRWRSIAEAPIGLNLLSASWTGREVIVFGSLLDDRNRAETPTAVGAAYDPAADSWRTLPPSALSPQATSAVFVRGRLVAWDYDVHAQEYEPRRDVWTEQVELPLTFSECYPESVVAGAAVFAWFCGQAATFDADAGTWAPIRGGVLEPKVATGAGELPEFRFVSLVGAGDVVALTAEGITVDASGEVCYGCPGSAVTAWVYRPPR